MSAGSSNGASRAEVEAKAREFVEAMDVDEKREKARPSLLAGVAKRWKELTVIGVILGAGAVGYSATVMPLERHKGQDAVLHAKQKSDMTMIADQLQWQSEAIWAISHGEIIKDPPPVAAISQ